MKLRHFCLLGCTSLLILACGKDKQSGVVIETTTLSSRVMLPPSTALRWKSATLAQSSLSPDSLVSGTWGFDSIPLGLYTLQVQDSSGTQWSQAMQVDTLRAFWVNPVGPFAQISNPVVQKRNCGVGTGAGQWALDEFCWYVEADAFEGKGNSRAQMLSHDEELVSAELTTGDSLYSDVYAKLNGTFSLNQAPYNLSYYTQIVIDANIADGDTLEVQFLQSAPTVDYPVWYTATVIGKGRANYAILFADLVKWKPTIEIAFDPSMIYGISFRNQRPGQDVRLEVYGLGAR